MSLVSYQAHYMSPVGENPQSGVFDFESEHKLNSKQNLQDARFKMLELFGKEAVAWNIVKVEKKSSKDNTLDFQPAFDFREPQKSHRQTRSVKRGTL